MTNFPWRSVRTGGRGARPGVSSDSEFFGSDVLKIVTSASATGSSLPMRRTMPSIEAFEDAVPNCDCAGAAGDCSKRRMAIAIEETAILIGAYPTVLNWYRKVSREV